MEEVTLGEIARKLDRHIDDTRTNNKNQNDILQLLLTQSTESKGRIDGCIERLAEQKAKIAAMDADTENLKGSKKYFTGAIAIIWIVLGFSPFMLGLYVREIMHDVLAQFEIKVQ